MAPTLEEELRQNPFIEVNDVKAEEIIQRIQTDIPSAQVKAFDLTGGGDHWQLNIVAKEFQGLTLVEQHQLVYKSLGAWMHGPIHALALTTRTPE